MLRRLLHACFREHLGMGLYNLIHILLFPELPAVVRRIPAGTRRLFDVGCGSGLYALLAALANPAIEIIGVDSQPARIKIATALSKRLGLKNVTFRCEDFFSATVPDTDVVLLADVLLYFDPERQNLLLRRLVSTLREGGLLLLKSHDTWPRWKRGCLSIEEALGRVARRLLGTEQDQSYMPRRLALKPVTEREAELRALGLSVESVRLDRGAILPHVLIVASRKRHRAV